MTLSQVHAGLAQSGTLFMGILAIWALYNGFRTRSLEGSWYGAAVIGEVLILAQFCVGVILYLQGMPLPRPYLHILYGLVAVITLPAAYGYLSQIKDVRALAFGMAVVSFFLLFVLIRASTVVDPLAPVLTSMLSGILAGM